MKKLINYFTTFEWALVLGMVLANIITGGFSDWLGATVSITGVLTVVLVAKGKMANFYFGIVNVALYAVMAYQWQLYGEVMLNALFYLPTQFWGLYLWKKHYDNGADEVVARKLTREQVLKLALASCLAIVVYANILGWIGGATPYLDATSTVLSIFGQLLMLFAFSANWVLWIIVNVVSVLMWAIPALTGDPGAVSMLLMWTAYLINSVYGYVNWKKLELN